MRKKHMPFPQMSRGFSLIELSIVLAVAGLILTLALSLGTAQISVKKYSATADKLDAIQKALHLHVKLNGGLPCPASKTEEPDTADFGKASDCTAAPAAGTLEAGLSPNFVRIGAVPLRPLNLPETMMFDAWGRRFTYAVTKTAVGSSLPAGIISMVDANGNEITTPPAAVTYVVFSSGAEGKGTQARHGAATVPCGSTARDSENCDNDITFRDMAPNNDAATPNFYDDIIRWNTTDAINDAIGVVAGGNGGAAPTGFEEEWEEDWSSFRGVQILNKINVNRVDYGCGDSGSSAHCYFFSYDPENTRRNCYYYYNPPHPEQILHYPEHALHCGALRIPDDVSLIEITPGFFSSSEPGYNKIAISIPPGSRDIDISNHDYGAPEFWRFLHAGFGIRIRFIE